ncbi:MAG: acetate kinase [Lachnospiraceae bacterium]|nr:acetate kinase [Lachnospiraceae bacterium]
MNILVINCGSSSLKFQLIESETGNVLGKGLCDRIGIDGSFISFVKGEGEKQKKEAVIKDHSDAIKLVIEALTDPANGVISSLKEIGAVGHRVVHGGEKFKAATLVDDEVIKAIEECNELAPLHNPANLIGVKACRELMGDVPMSVVFDTAFHQTMPEEAYLYGIPYEYYKKYKIRRYGFHGTSHDYVSHVCAEMMERKYEDLKIIVCHLGNGASVSAIDKGKCVDTSMGLTPLEGLIMGTRSGDLDPAILEFICNKEGLDISQVLNILNKKSGVFGLSEGFSSDFRDLEDGYNKNEENSIRAVNAFCYRVVKYIGAYVAAMNGVDAICFTAGIGENTAFVREKIVAHLGYLGVGLNAEANKERGKNILISTDDSKVKVFVIPTNEELEIAKQTLKLLK